MDHQDLGDHSFLFSALQDLYLLILAITLHVYLIPQKLIFF